MKPKLKKNSETLFTPRQRRLRNAGIGAVTHSKEALTERRVICCISLIRERTEPVTASVCFTSRSSRSWNHERRSAFGVTVR